MEKTVPKEKQGKRGETVRTVKTFDNITSGSQPDGSWDKKHRNVQDNNEK